MTEYRTIVDAGEAQRLVAAGAAVFDCSFDLADPGAGRRRYLAAHVPGARYLDLDDDLSSRPTGSNGRHPLPSVAALTDVLSRAGLRAGQQVLAYDDGDGAYAARLWWLLRWLGHDAVAVIDGGMAAWQARGLPVETGEPASVGAGDFSSGPGRTDMVADVLEVVSALGGDVPLVLDARAPGRFMGEANPLDPVPGHIPGARNRFFRDNLAPDGTFKSATELRSDFLGVLGSTAPAKVVAQCGSGVTACHDLLAMEIAGLPGARLYPGSWSEWIADPARPVETGPARS